MDTLTFTQELAYSLYNSTEEFPINFDDAWQWLEFSRRDSAKRSFENSGFIEGIDFRSFHRIVERSIGASKREEIQMSVECFKQWGMMAGTEKGKQIRLYFLECEKLAKKALLN